MKRVVRLGMNVGNLGLAVAGQQLPAGARVIERGQALFWLRQSVPPMAHPEILHAVSEIAEAVGYLFHGALPFDDLQMVMDELESALKDGRLVAFNDASAEGGGKSPQPTPEPPKPNKEAKKENEVKPKIELEYKVVLVDKGLSKHQAAAETKLVTSPTYIELSVDETNAGNPFTKGAKLKCSKADVKFFLDEKCTQEVDLSKPLTNPQIQGSKLKLYLKAQSPGELDLELDLEDPADGTIKRVQNPAKQKMLAVKLDVELYKAAKVHSKVFVDDTAPTHTVLSDQDKVEKGRLLVVQDNGRHGRAKLVVKKPDPKLWTVGEATYEVTVAQSVISGSVKLFDAEKAGTLKQDLGAAALKLKKADLDGKDLTFWVEGASETTDFRHVTVHLGLDRPAGGLAKTAKSFGDIARITVVDIAEITPTADDKQYVNLPFDAAKPRQGREITPKVKLSKPLKDVEMMFALVPHVDTVTPANSNPTDLPANTKHTPAKDADAAVKTDVAGAVVSAKLKLSGYGGDKFKVAAYPKEAPPPGKAVPAKSTSKELTIWKKIFYTLTCMKRYDGTDYSNRLDEAGVKSKLADKVFIEFERTGAIATKAFTSVVKDSQTQTWNTANLPAAATRTIHVGLIEAQTADAPQNETRTFNANHSYDAVTKVSTETLSGFTFDLSAQAQWLGSAKYEDTDHAGTWNAIPNGKVTLALDGLDHKLKVDLTDVVATVAIAKIRLKVVVKKLDEWSGEQSATGVLVGMRWREIAYPAQVKDAVRRTELHELGHYLGLCAKKLANAAEGANNRRYDQNGPHCNYDTNKCVMYHAFQMVWDPCDRCSASVRARDLSAPPINADGAY